MDGEESLHKYTEESQNPLLLSTVNQPAMYILSNTRRTVLYVGSAMDLLQRLFTHQEKIFPNSFTARYNCTELVYYELFNSVSDAYGREKQIKGWTRAKKIALITTLNPTMKNLISDIV